MTIPATSGDQPFSAEDAWVYPFSAGVPGTGKDITGFSGLTSSPQSTSIEHRGDNKVISKGATLDSVDLSLTVGIWNLDAISSLVGGAVTTLGTGSDQIRRLTHSTTDQPADCAVQAQTRSKSADGGGTRFTFPRCQPQNLPDYGFTDAAYQDLTIPMSAISNSANVIVVVEQFQTYTALTSTYTLP